MRYTSKRNKIRLSKLYKIAVANDMPLGFLIDLKRSYAEVKASNRLKNKDGEMIQWEQVDIDDFMITFPTVTLSGKPLDMLCACFDLASFNRLQKEYGDCPPEIATRVIEALEARE